MKAALLKDTKAPQPARAAKLTEKSPISFDNRAPRGVNIVAHIIVATVRKIAGALKRLKNVQTQMQRRAFSDILPVTAVSRGGVSLRHNFGQACRQHARPVWG
jgi:hypothetical protein